MLATNLTLETQLNLARETPLFYKVFTLASTGMILDAADVYMASAINSTMISEKFASITQGSLFLSAGFLGLFIGSLLAGYIGDFYGRKRSYQFNLLLFGAFTLLSAFAPNILTLTIFRLIAAIGLGAEIVTGYATVNEFAPVNRRGHWSGMCAIIANSGAPLTLLIATFMIPHFGWRSMFALMGALALILWIARHNFPESPRWLLDRGRTEEAGKIIGELTENGLYAETPEAAKLEESHTPFSRGLFIAIIGVSATLLCQYTFTSWVPTLLVQQGLDIFSSIGFSAIMMIGAPIGALIGTLLVDRAGRKNVITTSFIAAAILGIAYAHETTTAGILINGILITITFYILMATMVSVYTNELFATSHRFRGAGTANAIAKGLNTLMPTFVAIAITHVSASWIYYGIAILAFAAAALIFAFGPETGHKAIR